MPHTLHPPPVPAVLRLVQTMVHGRWRATGEDLYREVARLTEAAPGLDLLVAASGDGISAEWLAARTGAQVVAVDADRAPVERAERRMRTSRSVLPLSFETGALDDLPLESDVFDAAVGEPTLAAAADPARAVAEVVRVTKPMGHVVLVQATWSSEIAPATRELVVERLGLRPHLLVEWKQMLRDAGVVDIQVQDWSDGSPFGRTSAARLTAIPRLAWHQKMHIVGRTWSRWGWREARGAVARETSILRDLSRERALGLHLLSGVKWPRERRD